MIIYTTSQTEEELRQILDLQKANLRTSLTAEEISSQGFVSVIHSFADIKNLNNIEQHVIAKDGDRVVGYLLAMTTASRADIPLLVPMFDIFDRVDYRDKKVSGYKYIVIGQACVDREYRGRKVFDNLYAKYREQFQDRYDFAITEIATKNTRSLRAHARVGFETIETYTSPDGENWEVVILEWNK